MVLMIFMMTKLISSDDPRYFTETTDIPYDRHRYKIVSKTKTIVVESWQEAQEWWWNNCHSPTIKGAVIHVINKPKKKNKGFS